MACTQGLEETVEVLRNDHSSRNGYVDCHVRILHPFFAILTYLYPSVGFSPGVKMFGAGETHDKEAMVHHWFHGSWKQGIHP